MYAEGSTTGAGGMGTMSPLPTAAPLLTPSQPQEGAAAAQVGAAAPHPTAAAQPGAAAAQVGAAAPQLGAAAAQPQLLLQPQRLWPQRWRQHELAQQLVSQPQPL